MKRYVLALMLLVGCVKGTDRPIIVGPLPEQQAAHVQDTLNQIGTYLDVATQMKSIICQVSGEGTKVCLTLSHSLTIVNFAYGRASELFAQYEQGGVDLALVQKAIADVFNAVQNFKGDALLARSMLDEPGHPVAMAYCTKCVGEVVQAKPASSRSSPKPSSPAKAP
jgi:hypothetical protein